MMQSNFPNRTRNEVGMPFCMPVRSTDSKCLQVHAVVEQPLTPLSLGKVSCVAIGQSPVQFEWTGPNGRDIKLDESRSEAHGLVPGRYSIRAESSDGSKADLFVELTPCFPDSLSVVEYTVVPASTGVSHDGQVKAHGYGLDSWGRYLWTNGVETTTPILEDVRPGLYSVIPLPQKGKMPVFVHYCSPARVEVVKIIRM